MRLELSFSRSPTFSICAVYRICALVPCPTGSVIGPCLLLMLQMSLLFPLVCMKVFALSTQFATPPTGSVTEPCLLLNMMIRLETCASCGRDSRQRYSHDEEYCLLDYFPQRQLLIADFYTSKHLVGRYNALHEYVIYFSHFQRRGVLTVEGSANQR